MDDESGHHYRLYPWIAESDIRKGHDHCSRLPLSANRIHYAYDSIKDLRDSPFHLDMRHHIE